MLCPSIPIDKNKKGGRNYDSSKLTDFKKICLISNDDTTKPNQQTDLSEQRRAAVLASSLLTIPGFVSPAPAPAPAPEPEPEPEPDVLNDPLPQEKIDSLDGVTFFVIYSTYLPLTYNNNTLFDKQTKFDGFGFPTGEYEYVPLATNDVTDPDGFFREARQGISDSIIVPDGSSRQQIITILNARLQTHKWNSNNSYLVASLSPTGQLILSLNGPTLTAPAGEDPDIAGLFFGSADNGSTALGITLEADELSGKNGITGAALMLVGGGAATVTAPYKIGGGV